MIDTGTFVFVTKIYCDTEPFEKYISDRKSKHKNIWQLDPTICIHKIHLHDCVTRENSVIKMRCFGRANT